MNHLIITAAIVPEEKCFSQLGYSYQQRMMDYRKSFEYALRLKDKFDSMTIVAFPNERVSELENSGIKVYYSNFDNSFVNKGLNEMYHIYDFLKNSDIKNEDMIIKISGRYLIENDTILNIDRDFIAKYDGDIYPGNRGVHTFILGFKKGLFLEFFNSLDVENNNYDSVCIEWLVKDFMLNKKIPILDRYYKLGVTTCLYSKELNKWTRILA
jgi:hypothetical protein